MATVCGLAALMLVIVVAEGHLHTNPELDSIWDLFKARHVKQYKNKDHERER